MIHSYIFVRDQLHLFNLGGTATQQMIDATVAANTAGHPAVFFNLPVWMAAPHTTYPLGQEGSVFLTFFDRLDQAVSLHTDRPAQVAGYRVDAIRSDVPYYMGVFGKEPDWSQLARSGGEVFATIYTTETVRVQPIGLLDAAVTSTHPVANFGQSIVLQAATAQATQDGLRVDLQWQTRATVKDEVTVFIHVLDANGQLIAQADGDPLAGAYPFTQWPRGLVVDDIRRVDVSKAATVRVGLYSRSSGERLSATASDGTPLADNAVTLDIR